MKLNEYQKDSTERIKKHIKDKKSKGFVSFNSFLNENPELLEPTNRLILYGEDKKLYKKDEISENVYIELLGINEVKKDVIISLLKELPLEKLEKLVKVETETLPKEKSLFKAQITI